MTLTDVPVTASRTSSESFETPGFGDPLIGAEAAAAENRSVRIVIVDDHQIVRAGLQNLLETDRDFEVVGSAGDGSRAVSVVGECQPDIVLMDLSMPGVDGIEATRRIKTAYPDVRVLVLSSYGDEDHVVRALEAGADGYLLKHSEPDQLLRAIREALLGGAPLSAQVSRVLLDSRRRRPSAGSSTGVDLTDRERDVLRLVALGLANKQIAIRLGIAERTVKAHLSSVFQQLDVTDRTSAALWAKEHLT